MTEGRIHLSASSSPTCPIWWKWRSEASSGKEGAIEGSGHVLPLEMIAETAPAIRPWVAQAVNSGRKIMRALHRNGRIGMRRRD